MHMRDTPACQYTDSWFDRYEVDVRRLRQIAFEEVNDFATCMLTSSIPETQDLRALFVAWLAVFVPESIERRLLRAIDLILRSHKPRPRNFLDVCTRDIALRVAAFARTGEYEYIRGQLALCSFHKRSTRLFVTRAFSLVAPQLPASDPILLESVNENLRVMHDDAEWSAVLLLLCSGDQTIKRARLNEWIAKYEALNEPQRLTLLRLQAGTPVPDSFFYPFHSWIMSYGLARLTSLPGRGAPQVQEQLVLFEGTKPSRQTTFDEIVPRVLLLDVWSRVKAHPISSAFVNLDLA